MQEGSAVITDVAVVIFCLFVVFLFLLFLERVEGEREGGGGGGGRLGGRGVIRTPHDAGILVRSLVVKSRRAEN